MSGQWPWASGLFGWVQWSPWSLLLWQFPDNMRQNAVCPELVLVFPFLWPDSDFLPLLEISWHPLMYTCLVVWIQSEDTQVENNNLRNQIYTNKRIFMVTDMCVRQPEFYKTMTLPSDIHTVTHTAIPVWTDLNEIVLYHKKVNADISLASNRTCQSECDTTNYNFMVKMNNSWCSEWIYL